MRQAIFGLLFLSMTLTAQPDRKRRPPMDHPGQRLEMMKMWRLTEELDLSEEQAGKFFPRYNALEKEIMEKFNYLLEIENLSRDKLIRMGMNGNKIFLEKFKGTTSSFKP